MVARVNTATARHASEMSVLPSFVPRFLPSFMCAVHGICMHLCAHMWRPEQGLRPLLGGGGSLSFCLKTGSIISQKLTILAELSVWLVSSPHASAFRCPLRIRAHAATQGWLLGVQVHTLMLTEQPLFPTKASPRSLWRVFY